MVVVFSEENQVNKASNGEGSGDGSGDTLLPMVWSLLPIRRSANKKTVTITPNATIDDNVVAQRMEDRVGKSTFGPIAMW